MNDYIWLFSCGLKSHSFLHYRCSTELLHACGMNFMLRTYKPTSVGLLTLAASNEVLREISIEEKYVGEREILSTVIDKL